MALAAIALGSNLGDRDQNLRIAVEHISDLGLVTAISGFYDTAPVELVDQPRFLNGALVLETSLSPHNLLDRLLAIERSMGRDRESVPAKGPRVIDLDLLLYDSLIVETSGLTLPHPAMHERKFVLEPLAEVAPDWLHPVFKRSIRDLLRLL